jgi:hypothetical protein
MYVRTLATATLRTQYERSPNSRRTANSIPMRLVRKYSGMGLETRVVLLPALSSRIGDSTSRSFG